MNRHLLDRITPDKKDHFLAAASDLYGWNKTVDNGMSFVFEALKLPIGAVTVEVAIILSRKAVCRAFSTLSNVRRFKVPSHTTL